MYKGKIHQWIAVILIAFLIKGIFMLFPLIGDFLTQTPINIFVANPEDINVSNILNSQSISDYTLHLNSDNPDILFKLSDDNSSFEGYQKYDEFAYSPIVLYARSTFINDPGYAFIKMEQKDNTAYKVDLFYILKNMEENKTWKDIGVNEEIINGPITLTIPSENTSYYKYIEKLFYLTLANKSELSDNEKETLKPRVELLLSKCEKVPDVSQAISNEYKNPTNGYKMFLGPEFLYFRGSDEMSRQNTNAYTVAYPFDTSYLKMDMFLKNNYTEDENPVSNEFLHEIKTNINFIRYFGWRLENTFFNMSNLSASFPDIIPGYNNNGWD